MWLKIEYDTNGKTVTEHPLKNIEISIINEISAPANNSNKAIRVSKIFPLNKDIEQPPIIHDCTIHFYDFENPFCVLGYISKNMPEILNNVFFSYGACAVIVINDNSQRKSDYEIDKLGKLLAKEIWTIEKGMVSSNNVEKDYAKNTINNFIDNYDNLPIMVRPVLDETKIAIQMFNDKSYGLDHEKIISQTIKIVNNSITELMELNSILQNTNDEEINKIIRNSKVLLDFNKSAFLDPQSNKIMQQQVIDRLIQINAALSYVSAQTHSGSIPILERRSIIRRSSLLGVGSAIRALNNTIRYIEEAFNHINFQKIIAEKLPKLPPIDPNSLANRKFKLDEYNVDRIDEMINIDNTDVGVPEDIYDNISKINYFSSRYAFRETEYCITAPVYSITFGFSLDWSLMTLSHEMLHAHVRLLIDSLFCLDRAKEYSKDERSDNKIFYDKFRERYRILNEAYKSKSPDKYPDGYTFLDSIREVFYLYVIGTSTHGSISESVESDKDCDKSDVGPKFLNFVPEFEKFATDFSAEYKNINELFVHVLDLFYFYKSDLSKFIPMIWCSWGAVPQVNADLRQYILRSLLVIASNVRGNEFHERWTFSIIRFIEILENCSNLFNEYPILQKVLGVVCEIHEMDKKHRAKRNGESAVWGDIEKNLFRRYCRPFMNTLMIIDMATSVFSSTETLTKLWDDPNLVGEDVSDHSETQWKYDLEIENEFVNLSIKCQIPFILDRLTHVINNDIPIDNNERYTAIGFLALNSKEK